MAGRERGGLTDGAAWVEAPAAPAVESWWVRVLVPGGHVCEVPVDVPAGLGPCALSARLSDDGRAAAARALGVALTEVATDLRPGRGRWAWPRIPVGVPAPGGI